MDNVYCLNGAVLSSPGVYREALKRLDEDRRNRAERYRNEEDRIRSAGAGLLLQFAFQSMEKTGPQAGPGHMAEKPFIWKMLGAEEIFETVHRKRELKYGMGAEGKPYLLDGAFRFSLSHSGEYVICAVSALEVGADIQEKKDSDYLKLSRRFFTRKEQDAFDSCCSEQEQRDLFYLLWTRKEAYGKLTGRGLKEGLHLMEVLEPERLLVRFEDYGGLPGYQGCICRWKESRKEKSREE